jgi:hypothetical protein
MASLLETSHAGEFLLSEAPGGRSRDSITVLSGQNLAAGAVVGRVNKGIGGIASAFAGTGNGTMTVLTVGPEVEVGAYVVALKTVVADNGVFTVTTPSGRALPDATMAGGTLVYTSRHIGFTLTDGATDFALTPTVATFTVTVSTTAPLVIGGTGTGTMSALSLGPDAKPGLYKVINRAVVAEGGDFEVIGPDGVSVGRFLMGTGSGAAAAFTSRQVNFTLTDATDFILGNYFNLVVYNTLLGGKAVAWNPATYDGRNKAAGILYDAVDASLADKAGVIVCRDAEVRGADLKWGATITAAQYYSAANDLAAQGVIARM